MSYIALYMELYHSFVKFDTERKNGALTSQKLFCVMLYYILEAINLRLAGACIAMRLALDTGAAGILANKA